MMEKIDLVATIAKGGIHSNERGRFIKPKKDEIYYQCDIGSQYPNAIRKYKIEPKHLPGWNNLIVSKIERRLKYKKLFKETGNPKYDSLQGMGKLSLNGGSYGRLNTKGDWQQDPSCMLKVTMGGQLELLMIVEDLTLRGFRVVSLNTDGFDVVIPKSRDEELRSILTEFEIRIGNDVLGQFEYTEFEWIAQTSVNDYLAIEPNGKLKMKGDFEIDKEIHKNTSMRIVPLALKEYFVNNKPVRETVANHNNIYDFCIRRKSSRNFHYEGYKLGNYIPSEDEIQEVIKNEWSQKNWWDGKLHWVPNGVKQNDYFGGHTKSEMRNIIMKQLKDSHSQVSVYNKLIRYYVSNKGEKIYKIKNPECDTRAPAKSQVEAGQWLCTVVNYLPKTTKVGDCDIDFSYYIDKVERIIARIDKSYKREKLKDKQQLSLW